MKTQKENTAVHNARHHTTRALAAQVTTTYYMIHYMTSEAHLGMRKTFMYYMRVRQGGCLVKTEEKKTLQ